MIDKALIGIYLRGVAMGAADVVPGVSGGTIAFITGIYDQLLDSIKSINPHNVQLIFKEGVKPFWRAVNGNFLTALMLGILTSILSFAQLISYLLEHHPLMIWSFFFGLIAASAVHISKQVKGWGWLNGLLFIMGALIAYGFTEIKPSELAATPLLVFFAGSIAICAMILPGVSGSFLLVLMGLYGHILSAVKDFNLILIGAFAAGCGIGILSFAHILSWLLSKFHNQTMSLLTGFLLGSLNLVWPWKQTLSTYTNSKGKELALEQQNILPQDFTLLTGQPSYVTACVILAVVAVFVVMILEKFGTKKAKSS
jgi:putative membrane protein